MNGDLEEGGTARTKKPGGLLDRDGLMGGESREVRRLLSAFFMRRQAEPEQKNDPGRLIPSTLLPERSRCCIVLICNSVAFGYNDLVEGRI